MTERIPRLHYNLLAPMPDVSSSEVTDPLATGRRFRLERIVSFGQISDDGFWYDQAEVEWVLLVSGSARIAIEGESAERELAPGDVLVLPPRCRHRVTMTSRDPPAVWLALFIDPDDATATAPAGSVD